MRRLLVLAVALAGCSAPALDEAAGPSGTARVASITDGDTLRTAGGERVRLIGIDTPEERPRDGGPPECFAAAATAELARLVLGREVVLEQDAEARDRYGRLLAYVRRGEVDVNGALVRGGFAKTLEVEPNTSRRGELEAFEREARAAGRGLWGACDG